MKTITKTYETYTFDELDKKIQDNIIDFNFRTMFGSELKSKFFKSLHSKDKKIAKNSIKYLQDSAREILYLKNGDVCPL